MRPWIVSGTLADVLTAVQAVAGACNRPGVATRFHPAEQEVNLLLATEPAQVLAEHIRAQGLRTGNRSGLADAFRRSADRGGVRVLVTDDSSLATGGPAVVVALGDAGNGPDPAGQRRNVVLVPPGPVDVGRLARELADATAES